jgi:predicted RNA-binding protein|tara:strand:- start:513 stop:740 length:228 start_codon:yes stop_codon:yes gene_type:complete
MANKIKLSEKQLSDITRSLLSNRLIDDITNAIANETQDSSTWYSNLTHNTESDFFISCKGIIQQILERNINSKKQ